MGSVLSHRIFERSTRGICGIDNTYSQLANNFRTSTKTNKTEIQTLNSFNTMYHLEPCIHISISTVAGAQMWIDIHKTKYYKLN